MPAWLLLLALVLLPLGVQAKSFPATSDPTVAAQERWGSFTRGYVADGCWHGTSATTSVSLPSCRAFVLETADPESLQGFEELTARTITYSGGDGTYWLGGRSNPGITPAGWTCLAGLHYCTLKADTPPAAANGLVLLGKTTLSGGAITGFTIMAPWIRTTPYVVPSGTALTFGVCPEAGPVPLWTALGDATSGSVRFTPDACWRVLPEWWGADPTGLVDSTAAWRAALAASRYTAPLECAGNYLLSATEGPPLSPPISDPASQALTLTGGEQIRGKRVTSTAMVPANTVLACRFTFVGTGRALGTTGTTEGKNNVRLEHLYIYDRDGTGERGLDLTGARSWTIQGVQIHGFKTGLFLGTLFYYGEIRQLKIAQSRDLCADVSGSAVNAITIEIGCNSDKLGMTGGIRWGTMPGMYGTAHDVTLLLLVEVASGVPVSLSRIGSLDANIYIEHPGLKDNYGAIGALQLSRIEGGRIHTSMRGVPLQDVAGTLVPQGLRLFNAGGGDVHTRGLRITGHIRGYTTPITIEADEGSWGVDVTGVHVDTYAVGNNIGQWTGGIMLGNNYLTQGSAPIANVGRGSAAETLDWLAGDISWQGSTILNNTLRMATVAGNPPTTQTLILPTASAVTLPDVATPSIKLGQMFPTRASLEAGASTINNLQDGQAGQCLVIRALGDRTVNDNTAIMLSGSVPFAMNVDDMLMLCLDAGVWREVGRSNNTPP